MIATQTSPTFADQVISALSHDAPINGWLSCFDSLIAMRLLDDDWDGAGALAPNPEHIDGAIRLVCLLSVSPRFDPPLRATVALDGAIHIEWQEVGRLADIEVTGPSEGEVMVITEGKPPEHTKVRW